MQQIQLLDGITINQSVRKTQRGVLL